MKVKKIIKHSTTKWHLHIHTPKYLNYPMQTNIICKMILNLNLHIISAQVTERNIILLQECQLTTTKNILKVIHISYHQPLVIHLVLRLFKMHPRRDGMSPRLKMHQGISIQIITKIKSFKRQNRRKQNINMSLIKMITPN